MNVIKMIKKPIKSVYFFYRNKTSSKRVTPDFVIIGGQRCGTTSLYHYLTKHQSIKKALTKEIHYFDLNYHKGENWYLSHFPFKSPMNNKITGEASPYYLYHPRVPELMKKLMPDVKIIVLLRNPIDRAFSHYHHSEKNNDENLSFEQAIQSEEARLKDEEEKIIKDINYYSYNHHRYSYKSRGIYINQIKRWLKFFPLEQTLILKSEDLYTDPNKELNKTLSFLNLEKMTLKNLKKYNYAGNKYLKMNIETRKKLYDFFKPFNIQLSELLGKDFTWD